ncbi:hypothetical protein Y032_0021g398 [Ancylostoma ceylanicum]|uniref:Uncharacterized protein n=1 Tax=Ancylostoma ceylanicum TaxID=53326 RepID=A0A016V0F9_9BILA|nr:hypothetical protein Y032_0021g398 [Ancylostoma ceylanicum]
MKTALIAIAILSRLPCRRLRDDRNGNLNIATYLQGYCREDGYVAILEAWTWQRIRVAAELLRFYLCCRSAPQERRPLDLL